MGLLTVPKHYKPRKGAPRESLLYVSDAEKKMIKEMTDGKLDRTRHGVMSAYMEGSSSGNYRDSSPGQTSTSRSTSSGSGTSTPWGGRDTSSPASRDGGMRDGVGANAPSRSPTSGMGTQNSSREAQSNVSGRPSGPSTNPANNRYGGQSNSIADIASRNWADVQRQANAIRNAISPQYTGPAKYNQPFNKNAAMQQYGGYPTSYSPMTGPNLAVNPMAPQANPGFSQAQFGLAPRVNQTFPTPADNAEIQALKDYLGRPKAGFSETQFANAPLKTQTFPTPNDDAEIQALRDYLNKPTLDPSMPGRLAETKRPGYGVPTSFPGDKEYPTDRLAQDPNAQGQVTVNGLQPGYSTAYQNPAAVKQITDSLTPGVANPPTFNANYPQARIPGPENRMLNSYGVSTADALQNGLVEQAATLAGRPPASAPASLGPSFGPETPAGPEGWQQGTADPTSSPPEAQEDQYGLDDAAKEVFNNLRVVRAVKGIMAVLDKLSGNKQYRDDVSLGTDESGRRTDRMPSPRQGGGYRSPGPGGDRFHTARSEGRRKGAGQPSVPATPGAPPVNPVAPQTPWFYPQYQSQWAGLPVGQGGMYGRF